MKSSPRLPQPVYWNGVLLLAVLSAGVAQAQERVIIERAPPPPASAPVREVIVERPMPAQIVEVAPPAPRPGVNWVPGHWVWRGVDWQWVKGHYVEAAVPPMPAVVVEQPPPRPSPDHVWVRGHWGWGDDDHHWNWRQGFWHH